jgi:hypothetical protein
MEIEPEKEITVRELLKKYPDRGYIVWSGDLWLLVCPKPRPLRGSEEHILDYKVKYYDDSVNYENEPLSINVK